MHPLSLGVCVCVCVCDAIIGRDLPTACNVMCVYGMCSYRCRDVDARVQRVLPGIY